MNWDLAQLMKEALEANKHIFKSDLRDDPEATKNLDPDPNIVKYIRDSIHEVSGITINDSISRAQFDEWKSLEPDKELQDGMTSLSSSGAVRRANEVYPHRMSIFLDGHDQGLLSSDFYISYPTIDGKMLKTLGEVFITSPMANPDFKGKGLGAFVYMVILWTCYKRYGVKYVSTHAATFTGGTSSSADRVYASLREAGVISPVRDPINHKEYLSAIGKDKVRSEALSYNHEQKSTSLNSIDKQISDLDFLKYKQKRNKTVLENAIKLINDPEEYSVENGGRIKLKYFDEVVEYADYNSIEYIRVSLDEAKLNLEDIEKKLEALKERKAEIMKVELSPEEVISLMQKERENYAKRINDYGGESKGDGMDHYQINHNALIDYFKMFAEHHPELCDKDGNLNIEYNNAKVNIV